MVEVECQQEAEAAHPAPAWGRWKWNASMKWKLPTQRQHACQSRPRGSDELISGGKTLMHATAKSGAGSCWHSALFIISSPFELLSHFPCPSLCARGCADHEHDMIYLLSLFLTLSPQSATPS